MGKTTTPDEIFGRWPDAEICEIKMWPSMGKTWYRWTLIAKVPEGAIRGPYDTYGNAHTWDECISAMDAVALRGDTDG